MVQALAHLVVLAQVVEQAGFGLAPAYQLLPELITRLPLVAVVLAAQVPVQTAQRATIPYSVPLHPQAVDMVV